MDSRFGTYVELSEPFSNPFLSLLALMPDAWWAAARLRGGRWRGLGPVEEEEDWGLAMEEEDGGRPIVDKEEDGCQL